MEVGTSTSAEARKGHKWWTRDVVARGLFLFLVVPVHVLVILAYLWGVGPLSCACGGSGGSGGSGGGGGQPIVLSPSSLAQPAHIRSAPLSAEASTSAFTSDTSNSESTEENAVRCFSSVRSCFLWPDGSLQSHCPPSAPPSTPTPSSRRLSNSGTSDVSSSDASDTSDTIETITTSHTPPRRLADTEHPAYGQHLLLDLYAADAALLNDKDALLAAMTQVVQTLGMTVLGAVNAQLQPQGVSVTIALAESHFTAHTYPEVRSVFVDLFTCGETELLPHLPLIASAFGASLADTAHAKWSFVRRGVRKLEGVSDLDFELVQMHSEKRIVYSGDTAFQHVDIVDIRGDEYWGFQTNKEEGIGEWSRSLFMDGAIQSDSADEHKYHEVLVHAAMLAHPRGPKRVAVVGGGEGATVREVLKHRSVQRVDMIELDPGIVTLAREHLQQLHNCSFLHAPPSDASAPVFHSCFDDARVRVRLEDAVRFFDLKSQSRRGENCRRGKGKAKSTGVGVGQGVGQGVQQGVQQGQGQGQGVGQDVGWDVGKEMEHLMGGTVNKRGAQGRGSNWRSIGQRLRGQYNKRRPHRRLEGEGEAEGEGWAWGGPEGGMDADGYDVIILDLLDPEDATTDSAEFLYSQQALSNIACSLRRDGVMVVQMGQTPLALGERFQPEERLLHKGKLDMLKKLAWLIPDEQSVSSQLYLYSTYIPSFSAEWSFALLFSSPEGPNRFQRNAAHHELSMRSRLLPSALPLAYVDGAVLQSFGVAPREWQDAFCNQADRPPVCDLLHIPTQEDGMPEDGMERMVGLVPSSMHTDQGQPNRWDLVAATDIPQWTDLGLYDAATSLRLSLEEYEALETFVERTGSKEYGELLDLLKRYAYEEVDINGQYIVCSLISRNTFVNHGCNTSVVNVGSVDHAATPLLRAQMRDTPEGQRGIRAEAGGEGGDEEEGDWADGIEEFNIVVQRNERRFNAMTLAFRDIKRGERLLEDYGRFGGEWVPPKEWCHPETGTP